MTQMSMTLREARILRAWHLGGGLGHPCGVVLDSRGNRILQGTNLEGDTLWGVSDTPMGDADVLGYIRRGYVPLRLLTRTYEVRVLAPHGAILRRQGFVVNHCLWLTPQIVYNGRESGGVRSTTPVVVEVWSRGKRLRVRRDYLWKEVVGEILDFALGGLE